MLKGFSLSSIKFLRQLIINNGLLERTNEKEIDRDLEDYFYFLLSWMKVRHLISLLCGNHRF